MTVPCTLRRLAAASLLAANAVVFVAGPALAQAGGRGTSLGAPTQLIPPPRAKEKEEPAVVPVPETAVPGSAETVVGGIRVDELEPIVSYTDAVGAIDGFGPDLWQGTSRALVTAYLPRLPLPALSSATRGLARTLLLTGAVPPPPVNGATSESVLALRLVRLAAMGDADGFVALARAVPSGSDEISARAQVEADFLAGADGAACAAVAGPTRSDAFRGEFWTRAVTVCDVVAGRTAQAQLALDLMSEQNASGAMPYTALLRAALGDRQPVVNLAGAGPLDVTLLRLSKAEVTPAALADASALALRTVALGGGALPVRLDAAERAEALGAIPTGKLAEVYAAVPFKNDDFTNALTLAGNDLTPRGRALFFKAEQQAKAVAAAQAEVLKAALDSAREQGRFAQAARVYVDDIAAIDPAPELLWFSENAARALYAAGSSARAEEWRALAARGPEGAVVNVSLWPLSIIASPTLDGPVAMVDSSGTRVAAPHARPFDSSGFDRWLASLSEADRPQKGMAILALLDSLGAAVPPESWAPFLDSVAARSSPLLAPLARAAQSGRVGEAVLLALIALGAGDPDKWAPETTAAAVSALVAVHLDADARALALDAAFAARL